MMETYLLSSTAPPSLETMLKSPGKKAAEKTLSQPRAKLLPGLSSPFSPTASSAYSITARRSFPLPVQPGHSHANLLKNPLDTHFLPPLLPTFNARAKVGVEEGQAARCQKLTDTQATLTSLPGQGNTRRCQSKESTARSAKEQAYRGRGRRNAQGTGTQGWRRVGARVEPNSLALCGRTLSRKRGSGVPYEGSSGLSRSGRPRKRSCFWGQDADEAEDDAHCSAEDARACEQKESKAGGGAGKGSESNLAGEIGVNARRKPALDMLSIQNGDEPPETSPFNAMLSILRPIGANGLGSGGTGSASSGWTMGGTNFNGDSPLGAFGMSSTSPSFSSYRMLPSNLTASPHGMANILSTQAVSPSTHAAALPLSFYGIRHSNGILPFNPSIPQALRGQHVSSGREAAGGQKMTTEPGVEREEAEWETFFRAAGNV